jgi:hypothetical protein
MPSGDLPYRDADHMARPPHQIHSTKSTPKLHTSQRSYVQMQYATQSIAPEIRSTLSGLYTVMHMFESMPAAYTRAFLAVAKHEGECVDHYAGVCGTSNGAMSQTPKRSRGTEFPRPIKGGLRPAGIGAECDGSPLYNRLVVTKGEKFRWPDCAGAGVRAVERSRGRLRARCQK